MADKIIGRVTIKVIPEVDNHRPDMERDMDRQLDKMEKRSKKRKPIKVEVELDTDGLEEELDEAIDGVEKEAKKRTLNLKMAFDYDDVLRGTEQIRAAIKDLERDKNKITVELNKENLESRLVELTEKLSTTPVHMRVSDDIVGARQVLKKIEEIRAEAAKINLTFKTDPKSLDKLEADLKKKFKELSTKATAPKLQFKSELDRDSLKKVLSEVEKAKRNIVSPPLLIEANMDMAGLNKAERQIRSQLFKTPIKLRYDPNSRDSILGAIKELRKDIKEDPIGIELEVNNPNDGSVKAVIAKLQRQIDDIDSTIHIKVDYSDQDSLKSARKAIEDALKKVTAKPEDLPIQVDEQSLLAARERINSFIKDESGKDIKLPVNPTGLGLTAARLSYLTRPRVVNIIAKVDAKSIAIAAGILKSLAGVGVLQRIGNTLENVITNFDKFAIKSTGWMAAIGNVTNVLGYMLTSLFTIGGGVSQVIGLAALLPALGASTAAVFTVMTMGFNNFMQSFSDIPIVAEQALAKLPPAARKARDAMAGLWTEIRDPVQNLFWEELGTSLQDFARRVVPEIGEGLLMITPAVARFTRNTLDSFKEIAKNGQMREMFKNLSKGFDNLSRGAKPFFDALNTLGLRGSEFLPRMGTALADMAEDFDEWITRADKAGDINRWIEEGIDSLKDMGGVVLAVADQFKALTQIIDASGGQGLAGFRRNMEDWARVMEREPFRSRMARILRGARDGASELNVGFKDLAGTIGEASTTVEALLVLLGRVGGGTLSRIADILGRNNFQTGLLSGITKVNVALERLKPAARNIGDILGTMFDVSGEVILGVTPLLNQVTDILGTIVTGLGPTLKDMIPILVGFVSGLLEVSQGPLQVMADVLKIVVDIVKVLPGPMQHLVVAFGAFLALRGRIGGMAGALDKFWNGQRTAMSNGIATTTTNAAKFKTALDKIPVAINGTTGKVNGARARLAGAVTKVGGVVRGIGTALGGIMSFAGGLGGVLLFTGLIAGITALGEASARQREKVEQFKATLDDLGNTTFDSDKLNAGFLANTSTAFNGKMQSFSKILDDLGISSQKAVKALSGTKDEYNSFIDSISRRQEELARLQTERVEFLRNNGGYDPAVQDDVIQGYQDEATALNAIQREFEGYARAQDIATQEAKEQARVMGTSTSAALDLKSALGELSSETSGVDTKLAAVNRALDVLTGGMQSKQDVAIAFADSLRSVKEALATALDGGVSLTDIINKNGAIDLSITADPTGLKARVAEELSTATKSAMNKALTEVRLLPKEEQAAAFAGIYEKHLKELKAQVVPTLKDGSFDPKASAAFDAWIKANGFDKTTVSALIDGVVNTEEIDAIGDEVSARLEAYFGGNPAQVRVDGNIEPLREKIDTGKILLGELSRVITQPKISAENKEIITKGGRAKQLLGEIDRTVTIPTIDADGKPIGAKAAKAKKDLKGVKDTKTVPKIDADGKPLQGKTSTAKRQLGDVGKQKPKPRVDANIDPLTGKVRTAKDKLSDVGRQKPRPTVSIITNGLNAAQNAASVLRNFPGSVSRTINVHTRYTASGSSAVSRGGAGGLTGFDGAVNYPGSQYRFKPSAHQYYASGGFSKPTSAHIAPGGSYVTYAEKETGGEAFIPLSSSKRARSIGILAEVARMFGLQLVRGGKSYLNGGISAAGGSGATYNITNHYPQAEPTSSAINRAAQVTTVRDRD